MNKLDSTKFNEQFLNDLNELIQKLVNEVIEKTVASYNLAKILNIYISFFIKDMITLIPKSYIYKMVMKNYLKINYSIRFIIMFGVLIILILKQNLFNLNFFF